MVRTSDLENEREQLKKHPELTILLEAVQYCETLQVNRIRYSKLRQISNNRLASLTDGETTNFGGNFQNFISRFEKEYEHEVGLIKRVREGKSKTFVIPNIQKIMNLFRRINLSQLFEEEALINSPIFIEYEDSDLPSEGHNVDSDGKPYWRLIDTVYPPGVYTARYYYKNGHPVFLQPHDPTSPFAKMDPDPFYKRTNYLFQGNKSIKDDKKDSMVFISDQLEIRMNFLDNVPLRLTECTILRLLRLKKHLISQYKGANFRLDLKYTGSS